MYTEAEAWRTIGEAFEAKHEHPEIEVDEDQDLADYGLCYGLSRLNDAGQVSDSQRDEMQARISEALLSSGNFAVLEPYPRQPGGAELRATLAYLFAEEAASADN